MRIFALFLCLTLFTVTGRAIEPKDVVVVANDADPDSMAIARYYMAQRSIPEENLVTITCSTKENIPGEQFFAEIFNPLRDKLVNAGWINGVLAKENDAAGRRKIVSLGHKIGFLVVCRLPYQIESFQQASIDAFPAKNIPQPMMNAQASVDGELALLTAVETPLAGPLNNPLFQQKEPNYMQINAIVRIARLDGPSVAAVKRLIDSARDGEKQGLRGRAYLDKGGPHQQGEQWLDQCGQLIKQLHYPLSIDENKARFGWEHRLDAPALYFGWWTHKPDGPFEDPTYRFPPGAVAIHISSFSGQQLRKPNERWGGGLIERGVAATVGNVYEPYLGLTHHPHLFLEGLKNGMSTGEAAYYSLPGLGWMAIFLGDPLYQPFTVDLPAQLEDLDAKDSLDQYVVLREAERIRAEQGDDAAFAFLRSNYHRAPGLALAYALAEGYEDRNERQKAIKELGFVANITAIAPEDAGLVFQIAELLITMQDRRAGYEILKNLARQASAKGAKLAYMGAAIPLAQQLGDRDQASQWQATVQSLNPK